MRQERGGKIMAMPQRDDMVEMLDGRTMVVACGRNSDCVKRIRLMSSAAWAECGVYL